jgi:glycosyltransferase involved in cell wall biosynthesis
MRIVHLTAGTGSYYCGSCMRDAMLVQGLRQLGHEVMLVPMYLPPVLEEGQGDDESCPIFFGGVNVYLQQKSWFFRHTPAWFDALFNSPALLRWSAKKSGMTSPMLLGEITMSMLAGENGRQKKELRKLVSWLKQNGPWDVVSISNALLLGVAPVLKKELKARIVCSLQGEDSFLDSLPEPYRTQAWTTVGELTQHCEVLTAVSSYYGTLMASRLQIPAQRITTLHNGIDLSGYYPRAEPKAEISIGFFARQSEAKGLGLLIAAFIELAKRPHLAHVRLAVAGSRTAADEEYVARLRQQLLAADCLARCSFAGTLSRAEKQNFLRERTVLCVPATYGEAFGLYVVEAWASGVPVVQPPSGAFPELIHLTGGGIVAAGSDTLSLANALDTLLSDPQRAQALGMAGHAAAHQRFSAQAMATAFARLCG